MGLMRFLWRNTGIGRTSETIKNIAKEGSLKNGIIQTTQDDIRELYGNNTKTESLVDALEKQKK